MVYITVGSAPNPILEFLDEWGTENFEVRRLTIDAIFLTYLLHS